MPSDPATRPVQLLPTTTPEDIHLSTSNSKPTNKSTSSSTSSTNPSTQSKMPSSTQMTRFEGRTFFVLSDFSKEEQLHLYQEARKLKERVTGSGEEGSKDPKDFRLTDDQKCVYLIFMENSRE